MGDIRYKRIGDECNQCGECCSNIPWGGRFLGDVRTRDRMWLDEFFPMGIPFFGLAETEEGIVAIQSSGVVTLNGKEYPWMWVENNTLTKGIGSTECPFLMDSENDERPCALVGTEYEEMYDAVCREGQPLMLGEDEKCGVPPFITNEKSVRNLEKEHPSCSFEYIRIDS